MWREREQVRLKPDLKGEESCKNQEKHVPGRGVWKALEPGFSRPSTKHTHLEGCSTDWTDGPTPKVPDSGV